uniref:HD/PDEase domain-containing protein n=1 Tax=Neolamprologus brichardi TaxID=32507 RepID=A0A3Q4HDM2_NEOBR
ASTLEESGMNPLYFLSYRCNRHCFNTPEFQRLRNIRQLGGIYYVYPGASHNRFEHSIGVAHLAGELVKELKISLISDQDILCVQIAGLCHDLVYIVIMYLLQHEDGSLTMFDHLVVANGLKQEMKRNRLRLPTDLTFIKEMIKPLKSDDAEWPYKGRDKNKSFLYEIVSNKQNGIDVDKFDYFARDCHHLGIRNNFDHKRFIMFARVCDVEEDGRKHICSRDKELSNLYDIFQTRHSLHRRACQHKIKMAVEIMIKDALLLVDDHEDFKIKGSKRKRLPLSEAKDDMVAYTKLTDQVIEKILHSTVRSLNTAREILKRLMTRDLYQFVGQATVCNYVFMCLYYKSSINPHRDAVTLDYGMKNEDPISKAYFYRKNNPEKGIPMSKLKPSKLLPECFSEKILRVYWKKHEPEIIKKAKDCFKTWCLDNGFEVEKEEEDDDTGANAATSGND